jgi:LysR family transcriptional regulator, glycine cleavage system transcriptional activator
VVCSPRLLQEHGPLRSPADLTTAPLIHDDGPDRDPSCPTWGMWFAARGLKRADAERGLKFNQSSLAIEAAIAGKGIALAKRQLALRDIADGRLVAPLSEIEAPVSFAYWLVWPRGRRFEPAQTAMEGDSAADQTA